MRLFPISVFASALILVSVPVSARAGIRVVSDIDDTTRIVNVSAPLAMFMNGLFYPRAFTGMRELYQSFAIQRGYAFDYVSGASDFFRFHAKIFLSDSGFPKGSLHLKSSFKTESLRDYKVRVIRGLIEKNPQDQFILIGDDTQSDYEAYDELYHNVPDRIISIYIRTVTNRKLPPSAYSFLTAFDIASTEYLMGRLAVEEAGPVALAILSETRMNRIVPKFSYCPAHPFLTLDARMDEWNQKIDVRIQQICHTRKTSVE